MVDMNNRDASPDRSILSAVPALNVMALAESPSRRQYSAMRQEMFPPTVHSTEIASQGRRGSSLNPDMRLPGSISDVPSSTRAVGGTSHKRVSRGLFSRRSGAYALEDVGDIGLPPQPEHDPLYINTPPPTTRASLVRPGNPFSQVRSPPSMRTEMHTHTATEARSATNPHSRMLTHDCELGPHG